MNGPDSTWGGLAYQKFNYLKTQLGEACDECYDYFKTNGTIPDRWKDYIIGRKNLNGTISLLIKTEYFTNAGIKFETEPSNGGVAISRGHGLGHGGCGAFTIMQQGPGNPNPGNTILNLQIGTRAWSGEFSDTSTSQGYITEGMKGEGDSTTCLQPRFITLTLTQVINLLKQLPKGKSSDPGPSPSSGQCYCPEGVKCGGTCSGRSQSKKSCDMLKDWNCQWKS